VGVVLGTYQTCRALANLLIALFGGSNPMKRMQLPLLLMGLLGWGYSALSANGTLSLGNGGVFELLALGGVGLQEV